MTQMLIVMEKCGRMRADMIIVNTEVVTMNIRAPSAEAVAVRGGRIIAVGSNNQIRRLAAGRTRVIDLHRKTVVPGLIDAHVHMLSLGQPLPSLDLRGVASIAAVQRRLKTQVQKKKKGAWIVGRGWDQDRLKEKRLPTRWDLDEVSRDNPVVLSRVCGHICVVNSKALEAGGISRETADSWGELVDKDVKTGEPTGVLREGAMDLVWNMPEPSYEDVVEACRRACGEAVKSGLTSVHWFAGRPDEVQALDSLKEKNQLPLRVYLVMPVEHVDKLQEKRFNDPFLRLNCVKIFADGSLGARTAALKEPYTDDPSTKGILCHSQEELEELFRKMDAAGFQIAVHAIGDLAVEQVLNAFEDAVNRAAIAERRHRVEHVSVLTPQLIKRIRELGLHVCVQPNFVVSDFWVPDRLGRKRARWTYAFKSLMENRVLVAAGSDAPVELLNPLLGVWAAVTRKTSPQERISVKEALETYTVNAAYFSFEEDVKGSIEMGKFADLTVLSHNPLKISPRRIRDINVEMTIVGGRVVYSNKMQSKYSK